MFLKKSLKSYDRGNYTNTPFKICTGEKTAGFIDSHTGHFYNIILNNSYKFRKRLKMFF